MFILPSYSEGFPMAVLEAAAHSLPIIMTTECNFPELAIEGGALEVEPTIDELHQCLLTALNSSDQDRNSLGLKARNIVEDRYTWKTIASDINSLCT